MITLTELTENYKKNINNLLDLLRNKVAVFDFDGTLTALQYTPDRILPCKDAELHEYSKKYNIYHNARTLDTVNYPSPKGNGLVTALWYNGFRLPHLVV